jgi:pimeloyl-ACP methyl ester carboxylesterase
MPVMARHTHTSIPAAGPAHVRRGYFECRYGQLHVHHAMAPGGGFEEGTALLCLHDCPGSGRAFVSFAELAGRDRSVYAPDLPGFGESDPPPPGATLPDYVLALADFIDTMRLRRLDVLGMRSGAALALELALLRPEVARVVLAGAPPRNPPAAAALRALPAGERLLAQAVLPARERLANLKARLLVLRPQDEPAEATARLREVLPGARPQELGVAAGEPPAAAAPRLFDAVREFLRG